MEKNSKLKIVFLDRGTAGPIKLVERFSKYGEYIEYINTENEDVIKRLEDVDVVILNRVKLNKEHFEKLNKLKLILITATGFNHIDIKGANEHGIIVSNVFNYSTNSVAQLTMTLMLNELTKISKLDKIVKENKWGSYAYNINENYPIIDINEKILGIVGYGDIGKKVEQLALAFGMKILVAKIPGRNYNKDENRYELEEVMKKCDILTIHAPLSEYTRNLININNIKLMKKTGILLNLGRGPIVNEEDLYYALKNNIISSAAIDVMSQEPPANNCKLLELENITITPHIAWKSGKSLENLMEQIEKNLQLFLENKLEGLK